jgi:hypothetical protein
MLARIALLVIALIQAATPSLLFFNGFDAETGGPTPIVPAGYAFSIWGVIYALAVVFAGIQFLPRANPQVFGRLVWPSAALFLLSSVWLVFARFGPLVATVPTIIVMVVVATWTLVRARERATQLAPYDRWITLALFGLYAGWLTVATFANMTEIGKVEGFGFFGLSLTQWSSAALVTGSILACVIAIRAGGVVSYTAAIVWALSAIMVANRDRGDSPEILVVCAIGIALVIAATFVSARGWIRLAPRAAAVRP